MYVQVIAEDTNGFTAACFCFLITYNPSHMYIYFGF